MSDTPIADYVLGAKEDPLDKGLPVAFRKLERELAAAVKREREAIAASRQVADYNLELLTQLADANQRAEAAEADAAMWRDAYYGSAPSGAKLRCRKCGDLTEISFHYAAKPK